MARPKLTPTQPLAFRKSEYCNFDVFVGSADDLISAGIIERHMLPGQPGRNRTSVTINGDNGGWYRLVNRGNPGYIRIALRSKNTLRVVKGISLKERKRRLLEEEKREQQREKARQQEKSKLEDLLASTSDSEVPSSSSFDHLRAALATFDEPTIATFEVGELAICCNPDLSVYGAQLEITSKYGFYRHYVGDHVASEVGYRWGYYVRLSGVDEEYLCSAGDLLDINRKVRHIRRVK